MSREEKDKKNKQIGMVISAIIHAAVVLLFVFLVAWRAPNPPHPEIGVELNFGTSDAGTGNIQPDSPPEEVETEEQTEPTEEPTEEVTEPVEETVTTEEVVVEPENTPVEETQPVSEEPTPDPVKETEEKVVEKTETKEDKKVEEPNPTPPKVLYPGKKTEDSTNDTSQGDKANATGDQGDKEGDVDARSLYGKPGGGGGGSLEMSGWMWNSSPDPKESTSESGKIVFKVIIDERGEVMSAQAITYTVSAGLVRIYQSEIEKLTFSKTSPGPAPATTEGKITFIIKAK